MPTKNTGNTGSKPLKKLENHTGDKGRSVKCFIVKHADGWYAGSGDVFDGFLFYSDSLNSYKAQSFVRIDHLSKAAKGFRIAEASPVNLDGEFKSDFLCIAYMRLFYRFSTFVDQNAELKESGIFSDFRSKAIAMSIKENELESGKSISEKGRENAHNLMGSHLLFKKWFALRMQEVCEKDNAAQILERYAQWVKVIDRLLSEPPDPDHVRFLRAVEAAAAKMGDVPTSKAVEQEFNRHRSNNQIGSGATFRTIKKRLAFGWLPSSKPGPTARRINRAGKSAT